MQQARDLVLHAFSCVQFGPSFKQVHGESEAHALIEKKKYFKIHCHFNERKIYQTRKSNVFISANILAGTIL